LRYQAGVGARALGHRLELQRAPLAGDTDALPPLRRLLVGDPPPALRAGDEPLVDQEAVAHLRRAPQVAQRPDRLDGPVLVQLEDIHRVDEGHRRLLSRAGAGGVAVSTAG